MSLRLRRFFVALFALLQCVAPLLHAHTAAGEHGGVHIPEWSACADPQGHPSMVEGGHDHAAPTIGMESALEARLDGPPVDAPVLLSRLSAVADAHQAGPPARASAPRLPGLSRHLIPQPCAPPGA